MNTDTEQMTRSNTALLTKLSVFVCVLLMLLTFIFEISFWKGATTALLALVTYLLFTTFMLADRLGRIEKSRRYMLTRIYNKDGQEVLNKWTDQFSAGHWVTVTTDVINHEVLYVEHTRTDENINYVGRENCAQEEHEYNRSTVWGEHYKGPEYKIRIEI